jgi:hypothetical protein
MYRQKCTIVVRIPTRPWLPRHCNAIWESTRRHTMTFWSESCFDDDYIAMLSSISGLDSSWPNWEWTFNDLSSRNYHELGKLFPNIRFLDLLSTWFNAHYLELRGCQTESLAAPTHQFWRTLWIDTDVLFSKKIIYFISKLVHSSYKNVSQSIC